MAKAISKSDSGEPRKRRNPKKNDGENGGVQQQTEVAEEQNNTPVPAPAPEKTEQVGAIENGKNDKGKKEDFESTHAKYERIKRGNLHITDLQRMTVSELHDVCKKENVQEYTGMKKQELIFKILKERIQSNGLMYGEGVLEVLPDGYGFLRNPEYNYLSSPRRYICFAVTD